MKNNQRIFLFLFAFFLVIGLGSLIMLSMRGDLKKRNRDSYGATTAALVDTVVGEDVQEKNIEPNITRNEQVLDDEEETLNEDASQTDETIEAEETKEPEKTEEPVVEETPEEPEPEKTKTKAGVRYFMYTVATEKNALRLRGEPSESAPILKKLNKSTSGYVLKPGSKWCKIITVNGLEGYLSTQYLSLEEVPESYFPAGYAERVEAPDEELPY
ncbi:SH3 domain-containing protein [Butyrivibrio sp. AE3004]|uniref:SH3 domain-containing protein n=1 Tax=Butyrivibrio sp. AE3004 TaxID=1506994 RepID=UPI000494CF87|nr:SH3 domain-containing protein [Butyrivibrio sp. AE3004]